MKNNILVGNDEKFNKFPPIKTLNPKSVKNNTSSDNSFEVENLRFKGIVGFQKIAADLFKKSEEHYRSFFENSLDGIYKSTLSGKYIDANPALVKMLGYGSKKELLNADIPNQVYASKKFRPSPKERNKLFETQLKKKDGTVIWVEISSRVITKKEKPVCYEGIIRNITGRKKSEERIVYLSFHDNLTGLYNRAYFEEELKRLDTKRQLPFSFIIGDINNLKLINDAFGHRQGDEVIIKVSEGLKDFFRKEDIIARWGGDEFTILLPQTKKKDAEEIVSRINKKFIIDVRKEINLSMSLGHATKERANQDIQDVMKEAEDNMYRHKLNERKSIYSSIVSSLERTLYEKSFSTREHAERLKKFSQAIGKVAHLPDSKTDELSLLSTLHDIGKIAIPEEILSKRKKLTKKEWIIIKKHPEIGYNICIASPPLVHIAESVLSHHERWDGDGYPQGLKGDDIPITSRIISIVDAYDVMVSGRTYKKAVTETEAIEELKRCSGTQFDPELVDIFINTVLRKNFT